jgi:hypothetical protein
MNEEASADPPSPIAKQPLRGKGEALHHVGCRIKALNLIWFRGGGDAVRDLYSMFRFWYQFPRRDTKGRSFLYLTKGKHSD